MSRILCRLIDLVGRRGMVLFIIGTIWALYGLSMLTAGTVPVETPPHAVWHLTLSPTVRGSLWLGTGILAVYTAVSRPRTDTPGFLALVVGPMIWTFSYLASWAVWLLPLSNPGYSHGITAGLSWASVITLVATIASWPEPLSGCGHTHGPVLPPMGGDGE